MNKKKGILIVCIVAMIIIGIINQIIILHNRAPTLELIRPEVWVLRPGHSTKIKAWFSDAEGDKVYYRWFAKYGTIRSISADGSLIEYYPPAILGEYEVVLFIRDWVHGWTSGRIIIEVKCY